MHGQLPMGDSHPARGDFRGAQSWPLLDWGDVLGLALSYLVCESCDLGLVQIRLTQAVFGAIRTARALFAVLVTNSSSHHMSTQLQLRPFPPSSVSRKYF